MKKHIDIIERMMFAFPNVLVDGRRIYPTLKAAKEAFEKQMPKKPDTKTTNRGIDITGEYNIDSDYICPNCKTVVGDYEKEDHFYNYCPDCGQALDWSDTE